MSTTNLISSPDVRVSRQNQLLSPEMVTSVEFRCSSAPQSRVGSFKKTRKSELQTDVRTSLPSLEDSIIAKLEQLKQLEEDDCCVVRQFEASRHGIVNRGDSFRRHKCKTVPQISSDTVPQPQEPSCDITAGHNKQTSAEKTRLVLIMGDRSVGKTALLQQFMTSDYMAAMNTSFDGKCMSHGALAKLKITL